MMKHILEYKKYFNPKNNLIAKDYVENNILRLSQLMNIELGDYNIDEVKEYLIDYFTRFPDEISSINLKTFGYPKNYVLKLTNIGGNFKYL